MAIVKVDVRVMREVIQTHHVEVPDGLTDEEVREFVEEEFYEGEIDDLVDTEENDEEEEILLDTIERVNEGDEQP
jgi:hypothetical protein